MTISPSFAELQNAVQLLVKNGTGLVAIPGNTAGASPMGAYATVYLLSDADSGLPFEVLKEEEDETTITRHTYSGRRAIFSLQFYRDGAIDAARRLKQFVRVEAGRELLFGAGLTFEKTTEVRRIDTLVSNLFEERAGFDLTLLYKMRVTDTISSLETPPEITVNRG